MEANALVCLLRVVRFMYFANKCIHGERFMGFLALAGRIVQQNSNAALWRVEFPASSLLLHSDALPAIPPTPQPPSIIMCLVLQSRIEHERCELATGSLPHTPRELIVPVVVDFQYIKRATLATCKFCDCLCPGSPFMVSFALKAFASSLFC